MVSSLAITGNAWLMFSGLCQRHHTPGMFIPSCDGERHSRMVRGVTANSPCCRSQSMLQRPENSGKTGTRCGPFPGVSRSLQQSQQPQQQLRLSLQAKSNKCTHGWTGPSHWQRQMRLLAAFAMRLSLWIQSQVKHDMICDAQCPIMSYVCL